MNSAPQKTRLDSSDSSDSFQHWSIILLRLSTSRESGISPTISVRIGGLAYQKLVQGRSTVLCKRMSRQRVRTAP